MHVNVIAIDAHFGGKLTGRLVFLFHVGSFFVALAPPAAIFPLNFFPLAPDLFSLFLQTFSSYMLSALPYLAFTYLIHYCHQLPNTEPPYIGQRCTSDAIFFGLLSFHFLVHPGRLFFCCDLTRWAFLGGKKLFHLVNEKGKLIAKLMRG